MRPDLSPANVRRVRRLVLKVTSGADAPERCAQAFTVAATSVASGVDVSLWLTGEASWFALPGRAEEHKFELQAQVNLLCGVMLVEKISAPGQIGRAHV